MSTPYLFDAPLPDRCPGLLYLVCCSGNVDKIKEMLKAGATIGKYEAYEIGKTCPLDFICSVATDMYEEYFKGACYAGKVDVANYLLDKTNCASEQAFMACCYNGMTTIVTRIAHLFPQERITSEISPVLAASINGHLETVRALVYKGYDYNLGVYSYLTNDEIKSYLNSLQV